MPETAYRPAPADAELKVVIILRPEPLRKRDPVQKRVEHNEFAGDPSSHRLSEAEFEHYQRPRDRDFKAVRKFAQSAGLDVLEESALRHDVVLRGSVAELNAAFGLTIQVAQQDGEEYYTHSETIHIPPSLANIVEAIVGLDTRRLHDDGCPKLNVPSRRPPRRKVTGKQRAQTPAKRKPLNPFEIANYYNFPGHVDGAGQRIAVIEFAGGYHESDLEQFFTRLGIKRPRIRDIYVGDTSNAPLDYGILNEFLDDPRTAMMKHGPSVIRQFTSTLEVTLDVQIIAALAPGADIDVYFARGDGLCYRRAIYAALGVADPSYKVVRASDGGTVHPASVISISWGNPETCFDINRVKALETALHSAVVRGVTVCCSTGDRGSLGLSPGAPFNNRANVCYPATSQYVLACGGTRLKLDACGRPNQEVVWNEIRGGVHHLATTGGLSGLFPEPEFQQSLNLPSPHELAKPTWLSPYAESDGSFRSRAVPDVAASASMDIGCMTVIGGREMPGGGTSAAAPLWAALIARLNEALGFNVGWITPSLYHPELATAFQPVQSGNNRIDKRVHSYRATPGWDACTGLGSPDGIRLLEALRRVTHNGAAVLSNDSTRKEASGGKSRPRKAAKTVHADRVDSPSPPAAAAGRPPKKKGRGKSDRVASRRTGSKPTRKRQAE